jgi:hypothetical protein
MRPDARQNDRQIAFRSHPPERRRRPATVAACCCCSCCCCCLHSLGGLIGVAAAGRSRTIEEYRTTVAYWLGLAALLVATGILSAVRGGDVTDALLAGALLLPAYQLGSALIAALVGGLTVGSAALPRAWRLAWRGFLGALIGMGIMVLIGCALANRWDLALLAFVGLVFVIAFQRWLSRRAQPA